jgi:hypothetical protein
MSDVGTSSKRINRKALKISYIIQLTTFLYKRNLKIKLNIVLNTFDCQPIFGAARLPKNTNYTIMGSNPGM